MMAFLYQRSLIMAVSSAALAALSFPRKRATVFSGWHERRLVTQDGGENDEEFAGKRDEDELGGLTGIAQALVEGCKSGFAGAAASAAM